MKILEQTSTDNYSTNNSNIQITHTYDGINYLFPYNIKRVINNDKNSDDIVCELNEDPFNIGLTRVILSTDKNRFVMSYQNAEVYIVEGSIIPNSNNID